MRASRNPRWKLAEAAVNGRPTAVTGTTATTTTLGLPTLLVLALAVFFVSPSKSRWHPPRASLGVRLSRRGKSGVAHICPVISAVFGTGRFLNHTFNGVL